MPLTAGDKFGPYEGAPDGTVLAFDQFDPKTGSDIWLYSKKDGASTPFLRTPFSESGARFSPDGRWIAYSSNESGRTEIYIQLTPGREGGKRRVSAAGGTEPVWNPHGGELFYLNDGQMMVVQVQFDPSPAIDIPQLLFNYSQALTPNINTYDVTADGRRFVMLKSFDTRIAPKQLHLISNGLDQLFREVSR